MDEDLRALIDLRDRTIQKSRIAFGNRMDAIERGTDKDVNGNYKMVMRWRDNFQRMEYEVDEDIRERITNVPIIDEMVKVRGVGKMLAAKVACMIDIERADTISALWRYAGFGVVDGIAEKKRKGEKLHYNNRLKTSCFLVATSFLRTKSPYSTIYYNAKEYYAANRDWNKLHIHYAAQRKMIKVWLSHLWIVWRGMYGLPITEPWIIGKDSHTHEHNREHYGWEV